jgi:hypothetical protein
MNPFEEKSAGLKEHADFASYVNKVKAEALATEYHGAVEHELTRTTQFLFDSLMGENDSTKILLCVGALRGLRIATNNIAAKWPEDKEPE